MKAYFMPHAPVFLPTIGISEATQIKQTYDAMMAIGREVAEIRPETIVVFSPHGPRFSDAIAIYNQKNYKGNLQVFGDFENTYAFEKDQLFIDTLAEESDKVGLRYYPLSESEFHRFNVDTALDHGVLVPLYFITRFYSDFKLVCIADADFDYEELMLSGELIRSVSEKLGKRIVIIASGDLSHTLSDQGPYDYHPSGAKVDSEVIEVLMTSEIEKLGLLDYGMIEDAQICGLNTLMLLAGVYNHHNYQSKLLSYQSPFGVGYGVGSIQETTGTLTGKRSDLIADALLEIAKEKQMHMHLYCKIAYEVIRHRAIEGFSPKVILKNGAILIGDTKIEINEVQKKELEKQVAGLFVSIKKNGKLRGCIGQYASDEPMSLYQTICYFALQAGFKDLRFDEVKGHELTLMIVSVDILSELVKKDITEDIDHDVNKFGVVVKKGGLSGILLPNIPGVDNTVDQMAIAAQKADINVDEIEEVYLFTVERLI